MDLSSFREQFPVLGGKVWLKTPSGGPAAIAVLAALRDAVGRWEQGDLVLRAWDAEAQQTRALFARILGADVGQIALTTSVSQAAATVAALLSRGRVVVGEQEFRSNLFPWLALRERGFVVSEVPMPDGVLRTERLLEAIGSDVALVAVSDVQSGSGSRVDLVAIGDRCREVGARLFVDATQSVGVLRFPLAEAAPDYVAVHGYKWLVAPRGAAWFYVRDQVRDQVPLAPSWRSAPDPFASFYGGPLALAMDARRFDSSLGWPTWLGARAALQLIGSLDIEAAESRALALADRFVLELADLGLPVAGSDMRSHIVSFAVPAQERALERLAAAGILVTVRGGRVRAGFHAFNDETDVDRAVVAVTAAIAG